MKILNRLGSAFQTWPRNYQWISGLKNEPKFCENLSKSKYVKIYLKQKTLERIFQQLENLCVERTPICSKKPLMETFPSLCGGGLLHHSKGTKSWFFSFTTGLRLRYTPYLGFFPNRRPWIRKVLFTNSLLVVQTQIQGVFLTGTPLKG